MAKKKIIKLLLFFKQKMCHFIYFLYLNEMKKFFKIEDFWKGSND